MSVHCDAIAGGPEGFFRGGVARRRAPDNRRINDVWHLTGCRGVDRRVRRVGRLGGLLPGLRSTVGRGEV